MFNGYGVYVYENGSFVRSLARSLVLDSVTLDNICAPRATTAHTPFWHTGDIYAGVFENDEFNGQGRWSSVKKDFYEGQFVAGKRQGNGVYSYGNGAKYDGEWREGLFHGKGTYLFPNKDKYIGEVRLSVCAGCDVMGMTLSEIYVYLLCYSSLLNWLYSLSPASSMERGSTSARTAASWTASS